MMPDKMLSLKTCENESAMEILGEEEVSKYIQLMDNWEIIDNFLRKVYHFKAFKQSLAFVNTVANIADVIGYFPQISFSKSLVQINLGNGSDLIPCDFILASKMDAAYDLMYSINS